MTHPSQEDAQDFKPAAERTAEAERAIQDEVLDKEARSFAPREASEDKSKAMQAGARPYPVPPFPPQQLEKPGVEADLDPQPLYDAPYYKGSGKLEGKVALITGGDSGIGRAVAVLFAREGAHVAIAHLDESEDAEITRKAIEAEGRRALVLQGDVADAAFCWSAVDRVVAELGGLDVLVNNAAFQEHADTLDDLSEAHFDRTLKTNL